MLVEWRIHSQHLSTVARGEATQTWPAIALLCSGLVEAPVLSFVEAGTSHYPEGTGEVLNFLRMSSFLKSVAQHVSANSFSSSI